MLKIIVSFAPEIISDNIEHEIPVNEVTKINLISNIGIVKGKEIDELVETLNKNTSIEDLNSWLESKNILSKSKLVKTINDSIKPVKLNIVSMNSKNWDRLFDDSMPIAISKGINNNMLNPSVIATKVANNTRDINLIP